MMKLQTYAGISFIATIVVIYHAFNSRGQFYPALVYLSTSKINLVLLLNMGLIIMCILWQLTKKIFLGSLREAEVERLNEQSWKELMEILFAITIFRQDFSVSFLGMVTALLLIKALHWLAQKRVEYMETTPSVPLLSHIRIVSFLGFLFVLDSLFFYNSIESLIQTRKASVSLFFSFEYMILATTAVSTFVKYIFYVSDVLMEGQWERKPVYTFYLELIRDLLHLSMYLCFFLVIFMTYGVPLHLIRELYEIFRNFRIRIADYIRYRKITSNMNDRFPDATSEELNSSDATCIICREEMTVAKKLVCGHLFHVHCLRSWLERQHTCPTCRALVVPPEGSSTAAGHHGPQSDANQQGTGTTSSSAQGTSDTGVANDNLSHHQARVRAAAAAASVYEKSYVYPCASTLVWSPGYAVVPQVERPLPDSNNIEPNGHPQQFSFTGGPSNLSFTQFPQNLFVPFQPREGTGNNTDGLGSSQNVSGLHLEAQERFLQQQIEILQNQLQHLRKPEVEESSGAGEADKKGKSVAFSSLSSPSPSPSSSDSR
ncbi:ERAD-associated E3 ubiquitin-protein ligase HRD1B-like [Cucurbita maxima]|uniref:RING-type E3 ubiquitin transferase n=1 Tax=Cucurbita maxima TaxID=3661 RepID=A0A6J1J826_CUCMA|nr:ERAD-associated E3 ubiquitin-protein ligase HRD1B-like [Cucurbita maxima]XP_022984216.1 ERAD-associated E3 ubiquitin-protein ligase HRD1B-like [Cucurbita maxima]